MTDMSARMKPAAMEMHEHSPVVVLRSLVIGLTAFLTVVDLFATQAILPSLTRHYGVTPAAMGFAVNASTFGMAIAGLVVGFFSPHIDRRLGILLSLTLLAVPTSLLAIAPNITVFTILRVAQGLCMASAFTLTLAYLGEQCSAIDTGGAFAAYITGNVASNLIGRLVSAAVADGPGLAWNFYFFAVLNLAGAVRGWLDAGGGRAAVNVSAKTVAKWVKRFRAEGVDGLRDRRSSRPHSLPGQTLPATCAVVEALRRQRYTGKRIAAELGISSATVSRILRRLGLNRMRDLEPAEPIRRYEREHPGELIHIDIKKLGRFNRIGHRITGDRTGQSNARGVGWEYVHVFPAPVQICDTSESLCRSERLSRVVAVRTRKIPAQYSTALKEWLA